MSARQASVVLQQTLLAVSVSQWSWPAASLAHHAAKSACELEWVQLVDACWGMGRRRPSLRCRW